MANKLRKGDEVIVIAGKDKGRRGVIQRMLADDNRVLVEGINQMKKHVRPNPQKEEQGGIKTIDAPLQIFNVAIYNPITNKADRVGFKTLADGRKVRIFRSNEEQIGV